MSDPELAELERMEADEARDRTRPSPPPQADNGLLSIPEAWKPWVIGPPIAFFLLLHLAPQLAELAGEPRARLAGLAALPFGETLRDAAAGWLWAPLWAWIGSGLLRLHALRIMGNNPPAGIMVALIAAAFDAAVWIFMGLNQVGAYSPAEQAALILLLKIEGAVILGLFFLFAPLGKRRLGQTDADWNR